MTVFETPMLTPLLRFVFIILARCFNWTVYSIPDRPQRVVLICAPHDTAWDFFIFLYAGFTLKLNFKYLGKSNLFKWPWGWFFKYCGGIQVDRQKSTGVVASVVQKFKGEKSLSLAIAPEGSRRKSDWREGFYHIARSAEVPVLLSSINYQKKIAGIIAMFKLSDSVSADIARIKETIAAFQKNPYDILKLSRCVKH